MSSRASERFQRAGRVGHDRALGELERQQPRGNTDRLELAPDLRREVEVVQRPRRDVDRDRDRPALVHPGTGLHERLAQDLVGERVDDGGAFGDRDELVGHEQTPCRVIPAHERFDAVELSGMVRDLRLVVQHELPVADRSS